MSQHVNPSNYQPCGQTKALFDGLYKAYADCNEWCKTRCPDPKDTRQLTPAQLEQMLKACVKQCRSFQARSPANE